MFPDVNPELVKLLNGLLQFNPYFRLSAKKALKNTIFDGLRGSAFENEC